MNTTMMPNPLEAPDDDLLAQVALGDDAAFRLLIGRKLRRVHALAAHMLDDCAMADDVVQEAWLRVWRSAPEWRPGRAQFDTWLYRIVSNLCIDRLRKERVLFMAEPPEQVDDTLLADGELQREETSCRVRAALDCLPGRQKEAVTLQVYQELSGTEAAAVTCISVDALESLLSRARRSLRSMLEEYGTGRDFGVIEGRKRWADSQRHSSPFCHRLTFRFVAPD